MSKLDALKRTLRRHRLVIEGLLTREPRCPLTLTDYTEEAAALEIVITALTVDEVTQ